MTVLLIGIIVVLVVVLALMVILLLRKGGETSLADRIIQQQTDVHSKIEALMERNRAQSENLDQVRAQLYEEISHARRDLLKLSSQQQERARQEDEAFKAIQAIRNIMAGSYAKGKAGEMVVMEITKVLPKTMWVQNLKLEGRTVEFAIHLPDDRYLPLDSKMPLPGNISFLDDPELEIQPTKEIVQELARVIKDKAKEVGEYIMPPRTLDFALIAVPPLIFELTLPFHYECYDKHRVIVISYHILLPFLLQLYSIYQQYAYISRLDLDIIQSVINKLNRHLDDATKIVEGKLSKGITQVDNASKELSQIISHARTASQGIYKLTEPQDKDAIPEK
ncbi:MAG TPA: DNA recombination protein RmuC [Firmicutes bacterium]|nr:DNA recombination protein RmuC [Bacillota bacterium]